MDGHKDPKGIVKECVGVGMHGIQMKMDCRHDSCQKDQPPGPFFYDPVKDRGQQDQKHQLVQIPEYRRVLVMKNSRQKLLPVKGAPAVFQ